MQKVIIYNWLVLAILSLLVCLYITIFETFLKDKAYLYLLLTIVFGLLFYKQRKRVGIQ
jgi:multisubunit Na+/H+ antiporter MnhF subunit